MPNYCENTIVVTGKAIRIKELDDKFRGAHEVFEGGTSSCNKDEVDEEVFKKNLAYRIVKMNNPYLTKEAQENLVEINYISKVETERGYSFSCIIPCTADDYLSGWYNWRIKNWGTKWDIDETELDMPGLHLLDKALEENPNEVVEIMYNFDTAWSPCEPVVIAMAKQFPDLKFVHEYREDGCCFAGVVTYENGECVENLESDKGDYRTFLVEHFGEEFYKCTKCGELICEWEFEDKSSGCCNCGCKKIFDYDGKTILIIEGEK